MRLEDMTHDQLVRYARRLEFDMAQAADSINRVVNRILDDDGRAEDLHRRAEDHREREMHGD